MRTRWSLLIILLVVAAVIAGILWTRARVVAAPAQPIPYSHRVHVEAGVQCLYCHPGALRSAEAGIPSVQKCAGCHSVIATGQPDVEAAMDYWRRGRPIPWTRVNYQPDFVYFSHQPHLGAGLNCESCHGEVGQMDAAHPVVSMDMGWCLDCHSRQSADKVARLQDCVACHK